MSGKIEGLTFKKYSELLKHGIGKGGSVYFDYEFVANFTRPYCKDIQSYMFHNPFLKGEEKKLAEKLYSLCHNNDINGVFDDFMLLVASYFIEKKYLKSYTYIGNPVREQKSEMSAFLSSFTIKDFLTKHKMRSTGIVFASEKIYDKYFFDKNNFCLGVGHWDFLVHDRAIKIAIDIGEGFVIYCDTDDRWWCEIVYGKNAKRFGGKRVEITNKKLFTERFQIIASIVVDQGEGASIVVDETLAQFFFDKDINLRRREIYHSKKDFNSKSKNSKFKWLERIMSNELQVLRKLYYTLTRKRLTAIHFNKGVVVFNNVIKIYTDDNLENISR